MAERLARFTRTLLTEPKQRDTCLALLKTQDFQFVERLVSKEVYKHLNVVLNHRNRWKGHGGAESHEIDINQLTELEVILQRVREAMGTYQGHTLCIPGESTYHAGVFDCSVRAMMGSRTPFKKTRIQSTKPLDGERIYLTDISGKEPLELLPIFRLSRSPESENNACYFYNRLEPPDSSRWVSYHFSKEAELQLKATEVQGVLKLLALP